MKLTSQSELSSWLPSIHPQVWIFAIGSLISGLGICFYWAAAEAVVADASQIENRRKTFALADNLGLAIGIVLA